MTINTGWLAAVVVLAAALAMPLSVAAQTDNKGSGKAAAPAAASHAAPAAASHAAPAARAPAFNRSAVQNQQQPRQLRVQQPQLRQQRVQQPQLRQQRVLHQQTAHPQAQTLRQQKQLRLQKQQASPLQLQRQKRALGRQQAQTKAKSNIQALRKAKSNIQALPKTLAKPNAQAQRTLRRNGTALVTPLAARKGRFAAPFVGSANAGHVRGARFAAHQAWRRGLRAGFVPWYGPVFWPYAYSDVFDYAFWPGGYEDGYFAYAYDDFFDGVFWGESGPPQEYVQEYAYAAPSAPRPTAATVQELCKQPGTGITAWPFADIERKVGLNAEQKQLLGDVKSAGAKAASAFKASCPSENVFPLTPTGRLGAMTARLDATLEAVQMVRPALETFYGSLSDEQKERFNAIGPKNLKDNAGASQASADEGKSCKEQKPGLTNLPIERIEDAVKPTDAQADGLKQLEDATAKAVSIMQAACPDETPITPPGRLEAMETRLKAMIEAAKTVKPALDSFYASLSSEQKARFNRIGRELAQPAG